ncbi:MarR family winged helix-turn-helix transcriptional regulator [Angelakisella massiliensis]|uniref:MarR family winged helix-turn-helix transcriptional regulator n=1 Tax=Angelakisella massiliensis TaxID=1871018 RepID=UPI0008F936D7|nr:MarR family transcriptional regulator [Angelakisella massiliensis]
MQDKRYQLFIRLLDAFDQGCSLTEEYDALLHDYNGVILFQAESQMIKMIGNHPGITASEISKTFDKTSSASSQLIRKLKKKGWVRQQRNKDNNRQYNLFLTEEGDAIYRNHQQFEQACYQRTFQGLADFSQEQLETYIAIQHRLNQSFQLDVEESRSLGKKRDLSL